MPTEPSFYDFPFTRRGAIALIGGGLVFTATGRLKAAVLRDRAFRVYRKGGHVGHHTVSFAAGPDTLRVTSEVDLAVKLAFVTLFQYRQKAEDTWRDGMLVRSRVETNDDGERFRLTADATDGKLAVRTDEHDYAVDLGAMHNLCFWNEAITRQRQLIDAKDGDLTRVTVTSSVETIEVAGARMPARRYEITVSAKRGGLIWYATDGAWVKAQFKTRGELLDYELAV